MKNFMAVMFGISLIFFVFANAGPAQTPTPTPSVTPVTSPTVAFTSGPAPGDHIGGFGGVYINETFQMDISDASTDVTNLELKFEYYDGTSWTACTDFVSLSQEEFEVVNWPSSGADWAYLYLGGGCFEGGNTCSMTINLRLWNYVLPGGPGGYTNDFRFKVTVRDPEMQTGQDTITGLILDQTVSPDIEFTSGPTAGTTLGGSIIEQEFEGHTADVGVTGNNLELKFEYFDSYYWITAMDFTYLDFEEAEFENWTDSGAAYAYLYVWTNAFEEATPADFTIRLYLEDYVLPPAAGGYTDDFQFRVTVRDPDTNTAFDTLTDLIVDQKIPDNPAIDIYEPGTFDQQTTHTQTVGVDITNGPDVYYWLLSETQDSQPEPDDLLWQDTKPTTFFLSRHNGLKTVYVWVMDLFERINPGDIGGGIHDSIYLDSPDVWGPDFSHPGSWSKEGNWVESSQWSDNLVPDCRITARDQENGIQPLPGCMEVDDWTVALYHLDGNAQDGSGQGRDGTEHGPHVVWPQGKIGRGVDFSPGTDCWIEIPDTDDAFDFTDNSLSVEFWFKSGYMPGVNYYQRVMHKGILPDIYYNGPAGGPFEVEYWYTNDRYGRMHFFVYGTNPDGTEGFAVARDRTDYASGWNHYAYTYDGEQVRMYINGIQTADYWFYHAELDLYENDAPLIIGPYPGDYRPWPSGQPPQIVTGEVIDEIRISNRWRTPAEIALSYSQSAAAYSVDGGNSWSGMWDDFSGETMDTSVWSQAVSSDLFVTQTGGVLIVAGTGGVGWDFNGYISQPVDAEEDIVAAVQMQSPGPNGKAFLDIRLAPDYTKWGRLGINWSAATAQWEFEVDDGSGPTMVATRSFTDFTSAADSFLRMSYDPETGQVSAALEGEYLGTSPSLNPGPDNTLAQVRLGYEVNAAGSWEEVTFDDFLLNSLAPVIDSSVRGTGDIEKNFPAYQVPFLQKSADLNMVKFLSLDGLNNADDYSYTVMIDPYQPVSYNFYNSSGMQPDCRLEVQDEESGLETGPASLNPGEHTLGLWPFEDHEWRDITGHDYDQDIIQAWVAPGGKFGGQALVCHEDSMVTVSDDDAFDLQEFTLEAWIKPSTIPTGGMGIIGKGDSYMITYLFGDLVGIVKDELGFWYSVEAKGAAGVENQWYFVALRYDGWVLQLYVNGVLADSTFVPNELNDSASAFEIGLNGQFQGLIDDVKLSDTALSQEEIALNYFGAIYQYSTDGGATWSEWSEADVSGFNGSTEIETITAYSIPFLWGSGDAQLIRFATSDMAGNMVTSDSYEFVPHIWPTPTPQPTTTITPTPTPRGYNTPSPTPTAEGYMTPTPTPDGYKTPSPTPTPSASPTPTPKPTPFYFIVDSGDYNGDGASDIAVFRPDTGLWGVRGLGSMYYGRSGDIPASGDYNGDGYTDVAIFRPGTRLWSIMDITRVYYGASSDIPVPADYDEDGICDIAIFRPSSGLWAVRDFTRTYYGTSGDVPVPADYNGSGDINITVFRPAIGLWAIRGFTRCYFGGAADGPVPLVYDDYLAKTRGEPWRRAEIAIFRPSAALWAIRGTTRIYFGRPGGPSGYDLPVPGRFSEDVYDDIAIFRPESGLWAIQYITRIYYGASGDLPVTR